MSDANNAAEAADNQQTDGTEKSAEQATDLNAELESLKTQLKDAQNKHLYLYADFENYKKRVIKERSDLVKFGHESLVRDLLQVADNLDRALEHTTNVDALVQGIRMVNQQLKDCLSRYGVKPVDALGQKFNPEHHEAVGSEKVADVQDGQVVPGQRPDAHYEDGSIIREHQKGYTLHGRLLRPARVVVATK